MIRLLKSHLKSGSFARQVTVLTGGTMLGRAIAFLAMPLLTRIYSPDDFAVLATYSAILAILSVIACMRLDIAIPLPESDSDATTLLALSLAATGLIALICFAVVAVSAEQLLTALPSIDSVVVLWLIPLGVLLVGTYQAFQFWASRKQRFSDISQTRISQAAIGVVTMLGLGVLAIGSVGLTIGHMLMSGSGALGLAKRAFRNSPTLFRDLTIARMRKVLSQYQRFPKMSVPEALANVAGLQIPILIIAAAAPKGEAGHLMIAMQVMLIPLTLVGASIGQVYLSRAPEEMRNGSLKTFTISILRRLALLGLPPIAAIGLTAPWTFPVLFGADWERSGEIAAMMTPWIAFQFMASPISMVMVIRSKQGMMLVLTTFGLALRVGAVYLALQIAASLIVALAIATLIYYALCLAIFYRQSQTTS